MFSIAILAAGVAACSGGSPAPAATAPGNGTTSQPAGSGSTSGPVPASLGVPASQAAPGGATIDSSSLPKLKPEAVCSLLTADEAAALLGKPLAQAPKGVFAAGLGTNCIYQTNDSMSRGTYIKVEFNTFGTKAQQSLITAGGRSQTLTVAGFHATAAEPDPTATVGEASMSVQLSAGPKDPALWIEAPSVAAAQKVAEAVLPRISSVH